MTESMPLHIIKTYTLPSTVAMLRLAMIGAALLVAALAFVFPLLTGDDDMLITLLFLGVAGLDLLIAVFLPALLGRMPAPLHYALYHDRLELVFGDPARGGRSTAAIPLAAVVRVEETEGLADKDRAAGFSGLRIFLRSDLPTLACFPHYDRSGGPVLSLRGLRSEENHFSRLKELVEKSAAA